MARVAYEISKCLVSQGHQVTVYTTNLFNDHSLVTNRLVNLEGMKVYYFENLIKYFPKSKAPAPPVPYYLPFIARKKVNEFDIIHIHGYRSLSAATIHHYAKKYDVPYILQAHGSVETYFQKGMMKRVFDRIWGYRIMKDAAKAIALTETENGQYRRMGVSQDKIEIVPNGIDVSEFENLQGRGEFRKKYGFNDNQKIILFLGRINKIKGLDLLANTFASLNRELSNVRLVIVGPDDGYLAALKQLIKELNIEEKVLFTGPLYGEQKLEAYVDADVYVLPSIYETFPVTVLEACACGTPVIVTDRCGMADIINNQVGIVVPYDTQQLQDAIRHMLSDGKIRQAFAEHGKSLVRKQFTWPKIVERIESIYYSCLSPAA
ncbi:glycosyltransferase [Chloroflexota bacterium]